MGVLKFRNLNTGQATPVPSGEFTVGRDDSTYVHVEDASVSRQHARIVNKEDGFYVEDLGSVNGTAARGSLIRGRVKVDLGEVVYIGSVPFRVDPEVGGPAEPVVQEPVGVKRPANRAMMRKHTERIPLVMPDSGPVSLRTSTPPPAVEEKTPSLQRNTVAMPNPAWSKIPPAAAPEAAPKAAPAAEPLPAPAPSLEEMPERLPTIRPGKRPEPKERSVQPPLATSTAPATPASPDRFSQPAPVGMESGLEPVADKSRKIAELQAEAPPMSNDHPLRSINTAAPRYDDPYGLERRPEPQPQKTNWLLIACVFLAGMGAGILIGLFFAKLLFIDLGYKAAS